MSELPPRDTRTGKVLESMVIPVLQKGGYKYREQVVIGERPGGGEHEVDLIVLKGEEKPILISLKWQQVKGTAEQKVPFEVICLIKALKNNEGKYSKAYVVLGGNGWTLRDFYTGEGLQEYLRSMDLVKILTLEDFITIANQGKL